jgi:hypothetical protein
MTDWLDEALRSFQREPRDEDLREEQPTELEIGDVCVLASFERPPAAKPCLVVVIDTHDDGTALVALMSNDTALATDCDPILEPEQTAVSYPLCVFTRFTATVWVPQIRRRVGALDDDTFHAVASLVWNPEQATTFPTGTALGPESTDDRWRILRLEADALDRLASHCERRRGELTCRTPLVDPAALISASSADTPDTARIAEILLAVERDTVQMPQAALLRISCRHELPVEMFALLHGTANDALSRAHDCGRWAQLATAIVEADDMSIVRGLILAVEFAGDDFPVHWLTRCNEPLDPEIIEINGAGHLLIDGSGRDTTGVQ